MKHVFGFTFSIKRNSIENCESSILEKPEIVEESEGAAENEDKVTTWVTSI